MSDPVSKRFKNNNKTIIFKVFGKEILWFSVGKFPCKSGLKTNKSS